MTEAPKEHCHICGAEMSHDNNEICKNFHVQRARPRPAPAVITERDDPCLGCFWLRHEIEKAWKDVLKEQQMYGIENSVQEETETGFRYVIDAVKFNTQIEKQLESLRKERP